MAELPVTKLTLVPKGKDQWPRVHDTAAVTLDQLKPGRVATVRTRRGFRRITVRVVRPSTEGRNRGRSFVVGMTANGFCRSFWVDQVVHVATPQRERQALGSPRRAVGSPRPIELPRGPA